MKNIFSILKTDTYCDNMIACAEALLFAYDTKMISVCLCETELFSATKISKWDSEF